MPTSPQDPPLSVVRFIWLAFMAAILAYGAILSFVLKPAAEAEAPSQAILILALVAAGQLAAAFAFPQLFTRQATTYLSACIIRWALLEAIGVYGVIARILGAELTHSAIFLGVSLVSLSLLGPSEDGRRQFERERPGT